MGENKKWIVVVVDELVFIAMFGLVFGICEYIFLCGERDLIGMIK